MLGRMAIVTSPAYTPLERHALRRKVALAYRDSMTEPAREVGASIAAAGILHRCGLADVHFV
jgi:hypothetical protein